MARKYCNLDLLPFIYIFEEQNAIPLYIYADKHTHILQILIISIIHSKCEEKFLESLNTFNIYREIPYSK